MANGDTKQLPQEKRSELSKAVKKMEQDGLSKDKIQSAVDRYVEKHGKKKADAESTSRTSGRQQKSSGKQLQEGEFPTTSQIRKGYQRSDSQPSGRQLSDGLSDITGQESGLPTDRDLFGQTQEQPQQLEGGPITAPEQPDEEQQIEQNTSRTLNQFESISDELEKVEDNLSGKSYAKALSPSSIDESESNQLKKQKEQLSEQLDRKREPVISKLQDLASNAVDEKNINQFTQETAESELTEGEAVGKTPDPAKAREKANELVKQYGEFVPEDGKVARLLENEIKARVEHKLNEPEIEKKFNEKFKNEFGKSLEQFKKDSEMDATLDVANRAIEQAKVETEIANVKQELDKEYKQQVESRTEEEAAEIKQQADALKQGFQQQKQQIEAEAQQIKDRYQRREITYQQAQDTISQLNSKAEEQAEDVKAKMSQANEQLLDTFNQVKTNLKDKYNERLKDVQQLGQEKLKERLKDWEDDPNIDQPTKEQINKLYKQAAVDVYQKEEDERQAFAEALGDQWGGSELLFSQSLGSSIGGAVKSLGSMWDFDGMRTFGESTELYFNPPQDAEREWSDLLDPNKMAQISGQFAGSTAPSFLAGGLTAALTGGLGAGAGATMAASGLVSGAMETMQIGGAEFEQGLTETKSFQEAQRRMNESIKGQIAISPLYALEGLPFVPSMAGKVGRKLMGGSKVARPSMVKRTTGAATGELGTEFAQELTQESFAESIREGGKWYEGFQNILDADKAKQTFINVSPALIMGGAPQAMSSAMSPKEKAGKFIKAQDQKESLRDFAPDQYKQKIANVADVQGANRAKELVEGYYANGNIDKATKQDLEATIDRNGELDQEADEIGLEEGQKKVFKALNIKRQEAERKMGGTDSESVKKSYDRKVKEIQGQIDNLINEGQADFGTVRYADQNEMVFTLGELNRALDNEAVQDMVRNGEIQVTAQPYQDNDTFNKIDQKLKEIQPQETENIELDENEQKVLEQVRQDSEVNEARVGTRSEIIQRKYGIKDPERATAIAQKAFGEQTTGGEYAQETGEVRQEGQETGQEQGQRMGDMQEQQQAQAQEETQEAEVAEQETQEQLDAQTVETINTEVAEVEGIAQSISQLKEQNQQHFKKNGEPRKNAPQEVKDEYERLTNEYTERASQVQGNVEQRVKELENRERELSEQETQEINRQFEEKQQEFIDEYGLSEDEVLEQSAEQKVEQGLTLTQKELEYANENFYKPEGYQFNERGELISETEQTEEVSETVKPPEQTEVTQPSVELQEKDDFAQDAGFENLDQAANSVRKNLDKEVDRESITFEDIQSAAQQSESIQAVQDQSEEQLVEEANEKLDQIEEGKSPAQLEVGGQKITQVINNLSPDNRSKVIGKYQDKQQQYQKQQGKLAEQKDEVAQAKESLNEAFSKWLEGNQGVGIANDPKQRAKEDVELMNALKNYAQALAARGVKNFNEFVKELPAKLKENLTNANLKEAWDEGKQGVKKGTQKGAKQQTREATGQKKDDNIITINERDALKQQIKDAERGRKEGKLDEQKARESLVEGIRETIKGMEGKLTSSKINMLLKKVTSVNLSKPDKVNKLLAYVDNLVEDSNNKVYESRLNEFLKKIHPNKFKEQRVSGIPKGKIDNEVRKQLRQIHDAAKNKTIDQINEELDQLRAKLEDGQDVTREMESLIIAKKAKQGLQEISEAENMAKDLVKVGKSSLKEKLNEKHKEYQENKKKVLDAASEGKGVLTGFEKKKREAETRKWLQNLLGGVNGFLDKIEGLRTLLDKVDKSKKTETGGFGGVLDNVIYKRIAESRQRENGFNQKDQELLHQKLKEIYGSKKAVRKAMNENSQEQEVGTFTDLNGNEVTITLSQNQGYHLYNLMKAEELIDTFVDMGWTDEMMDAVKNFLTPEVKKWADWQVDEFYPMIYDRVNSEYKKMNYIDLKAHENYVPIRRENVEQGADEEIGTFKNNLVDASYGSLKERTASKAPFDVSADGDAMLMKHIAGMNHYAAFAESVKNMSVTFGDKNVREAIKQNNNKDVVSILDSFQRDIARGGVDKAKVISQLEFLRTNVATATLGLNPTIYVKQLTSMVAYMSNIPSGDFLKGMGDFAENPHKAIRILNESDYIKNRYTEGFDRDMADAMARDYKQKLGGKQNWKSRMMFLVKWGDKGAIVAGGYSIYRHHYKKAKKKGMGDQEAHLNALYEFEEATKLSQQSTSIEDLSEFQRGGTFAKLFTMYMTSPIAYFRQERKSIRDLVRGGNRKDAAKRFAIYHFVVPAMFQYIASGLPGLMSEWDEEDTKDLTRAMTIGSLNGIFFFGQLLEFGGDYITGKPWAELGEFEPIPAMSQVTSVVKGLGDVVKESAEGELDQDMFDAIMEASTASIDIGTGIPASRLQKFYENYQLILGDRNTTVSEDVLLAGGYSPYIVLGSEYKAYIPNLERDVIKGLKKKDVTVSEPQQPKGVSKDKYQDYVAEFNRLMSNKVNDNWEELKDKPKKELDKIIRDYRGEAREHAKNAAGIKSKKKGGGVNIGGSDLGGGDLDTDFN